MSRLIVSRRRSGGSINAARPAKRILRHHASPSPRRVLPGLAKARGINRLLAETMAALLARRNNAQAHDPAPPNAPACIGLAQATGHTLREVRAISCTASAASAPAAFASVADQVGEQGQGVAHGSNFLG